LQSSKSQEGTQTVERRRVRLSEFTQSLIPGSIKDEKHKKLKWKHGEPIYEAPTNSAIFSPADGEAMRHSGKIEVTGWATARGDRLVERVEVSSDGGLSWYPAEKFLGKRNRYCWVLWKATGTEETLQCHKLKMHLKFL
jgi:hypothetical protein